MKKHLSVLLAVVLIMLSVTPMIAAQTTDEKISPDVRALIEANTKGGVVVEIHHHNPNYPTEDVTEQQAVTNNLAAQRELLAQIEAISYFEVGTFSVGVVYVGLPYASIEKVASLENVDYIDLPHDQYSTLPAEQKMDEKTKTARETLPADTKVNFVIWLAYNQHAYIGMAEPGDNATHQEVDNYLRLMRGAKRDYISAKNEEFAQVIAESCEIENLWTSRYTPMITLTAKLSDVDKIAALKEVASVSYDSVVFIPSDDPLAMEEKFQSWIYQKKGTVKYDEALAGQGLQYVENTYRNYREVYANDQWALVYAEVNVLDPWEMVEHICIGKRVISWWTPGAAYYPYGYFVYNAAEDTFHPIDCFLSPVTAVAIDENGKPIKDENGKLVIRTLDPQIYLEDYPGLPDVLDRLNIGDVRGDADGDGEATVIDATLIQRYKADMVTPTGLNLAAADADGDGENEILDATRIQRTVADICNIDGTAYVSGDPASRT